MTLKGSGLKDVAVARLEKMAPANCQARSYIVRDLSW
jgi:hypothetical protein